MADKQIFTGGHKYINNKKFTTAHDNRSLFQ